MEECIFCKIARNEIESHRIYEDENFVAMLDKFPYSKGHTIIIPKGHYPQVWDLPEVLYLEYTTVVRNVALSMKEKTGSDFVYSHISGNDIAHAHIHVIPNFGKTYGEILETKSNEKITDEDARRVVDMLKMD